MPPVGFLSRTCLAQPQPHPARSRSPTHILLHTYGNNHAKRRAACSSRSGCPLNTTSTASPTTVTLSCLYSLERGGVQKRTRTERALRQSGSRGPCARGRCSCLQPIFAIQVLLLAHTKWFTHLGLRPARLRRQQPCRQMHGSECGCSTGGLLRRLYPPCCRRTTAVLESHHTTCICIDTRRGRALCCLRSCRPCAFDALQGMHPSCMHLESCRAFFL
jgi:hypothetical protein